MNGRKLAWACRYPGCSYKVDLGTGEHEGIYAHDEHIGRVHRGTYLMPRLAVFGLSQPQPKVKSRAIAPPPSSHSHLHPASHAPSHRPLQPQPSEFSQNPLWFAKQALSTDSVIKCQLKECHMKYPRQELANACLEWHLQTGCNLGEFPSDHGGNLKPRSLKPNEPLYDEIRGSGQSGDSHCRYPKCGRRYATDQIAFMCRRWHRNTGKLVHEVSGQEHHQVGRTHTNPS